MQAPYFSVIVPTKNRSFVVGAAIQSILNQSERSLEVIVVDNDDSEATSDVVAQLTDPRVRYVRTGGLTMADNWERGYAEARGTYFLLLEDKSVLKPRALKKIRDSLARTPAPVVSWPQDMFNDLATPPCVSRGWATDRTRLFRSEEVIESFLTARRGIAENFLPRGLNSAIHSDLYKKIVASPIGRLCAPVSPDYTMAFLQLNYADTVLNIEDCLTVYGSCRLSHGWSTTVKIITGSPLKRDFGLDNYQQYWKTSIPAEVYVTAAYTFNDYLSIRGQVGGRLANFPLNAEHFFLETFRDIRMVESTGVDMQTSEKAWHVGLAVQPRKLRKRVLRTLDKEFGPATLRRRAFEASGAGVAWRAVKSLFGWKPPVAAHSETALHDTPLSYIEWENQATLGTV